MHITIYYCKSAAVYVMATAGAGKTKRKRVVLSIKDKLDLLDQSVSYTVICEKYGVGKSTVRDIKQNREKIIDFEKNMVEMGVNRKTKKVMKLAANDKLDKALYKQKRMEGVPISGSMLCEKAIQLNLLLDGKSTFVASIRVGSGNFANGMASETCLSMGRNFPQIRRLPMSLYHHFPSLLKTRRFQWIRSLTVRRPVSISACCLSRH